MVFHAFVRISKALILHKPGALSIPFTTTAIRSYREKLYLNQEPEESSQTKPSVLVMFVQAIQEGNVTSIKAIMREEENRKEAPRHNEQDPCPLRSRGIQITQDDVLILQQFITSSGEILTQKETGLCQHEYYKVVGCVKMAQRSNLLPGPENDTSVSPNGKKLNLYLTRYPIGSRTPIRSRGLSYRRNYYKVGDQRTMRDAPRISRRSMLDKH